MYSLKELIPKTKIAPHMGAILLCAEADKIIIDILGENPGARARSYKDTVIIVEAEGTPIISELRLYEHALLETLRKKLPATTISRIHFVHT